MMTDKPWNDIKITGKRTPGSWCVEDNKVVAPHKLPVKYGDKGQFEGAYIVCQPWLYVSGKWDSDEVRANTALIAAVPDMINEIVYLQAELAQLRAQLAECEWEDVPDGRHDAGGGQVYVVGESGQRVRRYDNEFYAGTLWLPARLGWRIQRRKEAQTDE